MQMYYGVTLEISSMAGDVYLNHLLGFVVEAPAILGTIFAVSRMGRRSSAAALLVGGEGGYSCSCPSCRSAATCFTKMLRCGMLPGPAASGQEYVWNEDVCWLVWLQEELHALSAG